jgi:hypothetical protein
MLSRSQLLKVPFYNCLLSSEYLSDTRGVLPYNYGHPSLFKPWIGTLKATKEQIQHYAFACKLGSPAFIALTASGQLDNKPPLVVAAGAKVDLDYENDFKPEYIPTIHKHLDWFYEAYPNADIALNGVPSFDDKDKKLHADLVALHNRCSDVEWGEYEYRKADWWSRQKKYVTDWAAKLRSIYPRHGLQCWLMPEEMDPPQNLMSWDYSLDVLETAVACSYGPRDSICFFTGKTWAASVVTFNL